MAGKALLVAVAVACVIALLAVAEETTKGNGSELASGTNRYSATGKEHKVGESRGSMRPQSAARRLKWGEEDMCSGSSEQEGFCKTDRDCADALDGNIFCLCSGSLRLPVEVPIYTCYDPVLYPSIG